MSIEHDDSAHPLDPSHLLRTLALDITTDDKPTDEVLAEASLLSAPGALAYAYGLVDEAMDLAAALGQSPAEAQRYLQSPLVDLLATHSEAHHSDDEGEVVAAVPAPLARIAPAAANDDESGSAKVLRLFGPMGALLAAAAAVLLFIDVPQDRGPSVKGAPLGPGLNAAVVQRDGQLSAGAVLQSLDRGRRGFEACALNAGHEIEVAATVGPDGLVATPPGVEVEAVKGTLNASQRECLASATTAVAFDFERAPTTFRIRLSVRTITSP